MAKASALAKAQRILRFLLAQSNPRIVGAMAVYGFSEADLDEGWRLLRSLRPVRVEALPPPAPERSPFERIEAWQSEWIPIARAALRRHCPEVHQRLFVKGVSREGLSNVLFLDDFLRTIDKLARSDPGGETTMKLLELRGLTPDVLGEARALLEELKTARPLPDPGAPVDRSDWAEREAELWAWYLEWSSIAVRKIKDRNLLRQLGFLAPARNGHGPREVPAPLEEEEEEEEEEEHPRRQP